VNVHDPQLLAVFVDDAYVAYAWQGRVIPQDLIVDAKLFVDE